MMKKSSAVILLTVSAISIFWACSNESLTAADQNASINETRKLEKEELIAKGEYLVTIAGCNDCHTPKVFSQHGMALDSTRLYSGHRAEVQMPEVAATTLKPGNNWLQMGPEVTAFAGPWGISYAANLTPDSATGIGLWTEEVFVKTLRTGRHLGADNGRPILPPMPWFNLIKMTDEDFSAIYAYLRSVPAINNKVPAPVTPDKVKVGGQ